MRTQEVEDALRFRAHSWASEVLAAEVERLETDAKAMTIMLRGRGELLKRAEAAEARVESLIKSLLAHDAERTLYLRRLLWLHDCSTGKGATDSDGYEWGIFRVKWVNGQAVEVWQTNSDFSDLDAAIERDEYMLPASAKALEARVAELETVRQDLLGKIVGWQEGARTDRARIVELEAQNARLRGDLEYAEAERLRLTARRDTLDTQIAALTEKTTRLKEVLVDCHAYLMRRITLLTLNESASDTTQSLARDVSVALDALDDGKAAP